MANASCSTCTLISNVLTLAGSVSGTLVVGMTLTGASVPPGVTITSFGTGSGGVGTYNCSASAANITVAEPMVFSLSWDMPLQGNASSPQLLDLGRAAGFGIVFAAVIGGGTAGMGQEYQFGTHQVAIHNDIAVQGTNVWPPSPGRQGPTVTTFFANQPQYPEPRDPRLFDTSSLEKATGIEPLRQINAAPQVVDLTLQPWISQALYSGSNGWTTEYQFGTHQAQLYDSQTRQQVFSPLKGFTAAAQTAPIKLVSALPQELNSDLTIQGWNKIPSVPQGWILTYISAGPQLADLTVQATLAPAQPFHSAFTGPTAPKTIVAVWQQDITQIPAVAFAPPLRKPAFQPLALQTALPDRQDYTQPQGLIITPALPGPSKRLQPAFVWAFEQQYDKNLYPQVFTQPVVFIPPVILPPQPAPPDISVWTADATQVTADMVSFTCDGADLLNDGGVNPGANLQTSINANLDNPEPAYTVSSPNFTPPVPGAVPGSSQPLPVTSPPMVYWINGVKFTSGSHS
jgi:hypothetical protein